MHSGSKRVVNSSNQLATGPPGGATTSLFIFIMFSVFSVSDAVIDLLGLVGVLGGLSGTEISECRLLPFFPGFGLLKDFFGLRRLLGDSGLTEMLEVEIFTDDLR